MEITLEEIQKKFESLPEELRWAIMAARVDENVIDIGKEQGLNVEEMGQLSLETHMVMLGFNHPDKFEESIKKSLRLPDEKARVVANAVNERVLKSIRSKMMQVYPATPAKAEEHGAETRESMLKILEKPEISAPTQSTSSNPIAEQKLTQPVQTPPVQTEHSLENISKTAPSPVAPAPYPKGSDPYRLPPE